MKKYEQPEIVIQTALVENIMDSSGQDVDIDVPF